MVFSKGDCVVINQERDSYSILAVVPKFEAILVDGFMIDFSAVSDFVEFHPLATNNKGVIEFLI
ncbi:hypothetical protein [Paenilisteria rocourtiae]|uniref:hypothetical protein n=1 Tax=Listeria rocourtiae TaxID=647910 RepID=UPI0003E85BB7|nr:hypothetical protein [Listeria rocourtiae]EUJ42605.1 hypothetical protein PROCOU_16674 [Listeria rocourtiae FSL F6-920]MBC1605289.1 hypothetical protein [Listeria rocourtiae]